MRLALAGAAIGLAAGAAAALPPRDALRGDQKPAPVVDPRLDRKVSFELKAAPLAEVCEQLAKQT
jgi:hypothetical protein